MKRRVSKIANFLAFNLLFFALYLNFIQKDSVPGGAVQYNTAFSETGMIDNNQPVVNNKNETIVATQPAAPEKATEDNVSALKLSIN